MRVLLVDDDAAVRDTLADLLAADGHVVTAVATHAGGVAKLAAPDCDVLLADMVLPDGSGADLASRALALGIGAVLVSGHPSHIGQPAPPGIGRLAKPFSARELDAALAAAMLSRSAP